MRSGPGIGKSGVEVGWLLRRLWGDDLTIASWQKEPGWIGGCLLGAMDKCISFNPIPFSMFKRFFAALTLSVSSIAVLANANGDNAFDGRWPLLPEGVSAQAGERWGELANGLRYVIVPTDSASEAVSLRLLVAAGHAQDEKGKAGTSQLLADLASSGTQSIDRAQLVRFMLANGMDPQARNFSTVDVGHTLYRIDLEEPELGAVEASIDLFSTIAGAPRFDQSAFEESKARVAHSASLGLGAFEPKGSVRARFLLRSSEYSDLGDEKIVSEVSSVELADLERYWSKWYGANRMVLIVTGVLDSEALESLVVQKFSALKAGAETGPPIERSSKFRAGGDLSTASSPTKQAGLWITNVQETGSLFESATEREYYTMDFIGRVAQSYATGSKRLANSILFRHGDHVALSINSRGSMTQFLELLLAADKATHRLAEFGIRSDDFEQLKSDYLDLRFSFDSVLSSKEWAPLVADRAVESVVDQIPFRYGKGFSDYLQRIVSNITSQGARDRCGELFREKDLSMYLEFPDGFSLGAKTVSKRLKGMRKVYDFTWEQAGEADQDWNVGTGFQSGGMVESTEIIRFDEYPVLKYEFANNLRMNLVRTDTFPGRVQIHVSLGNGTSELENANPAFESLLRTLMLKTKIGGGVEAPTIREMLESKGIEDLNGGVSGEQLYWSGIGRDASDVEDFLSGIILWMATSSFEEKAYDEEYENLEEITERSDGKSSTIRLEEMLYGSDPRLRNYFTKEDVEALDYASMRDWLFAVREKAYVEITVVGDVVPRTILRDVRKTFGAAPDRTGKVIQPRHGKPVVWNEAGIARDTFKMPGKVGNITLLFPQVREKSCASDRMGSVYRPLLREHLMEALAGYPELSWNLSVDLIGNPMIPLSNAIKVRLYCPEDFAEVAEAKLLEAVATFESTLTEEAIVAAERNALIGIKRIAQSQLSLVNLLKQSQGKPKAFGCVLDLLENGFNISFDEYKAIATEQFADKNLRGVVVMPAKK